MSPDLRLPALPSLSHASQVEAYLNVWAAMQPEEAGRKTAAERICIAFMQAAPVDWPKNVTLDLSKLKLSEVPGALLALWPFNHGVTKVDLSRNSLQKLSFQISSIKRLKELVLDHNQLSSLPWEIGLLPNLTTLQLNYNKLTTLPQEIDQLHQLTSLSIEGNQLESLPLSITRLPLTYLNVSQNQLGDLPLELSQLQGLKTLDVSRNRFTSFPPPIFTLTQLSTLLISGNKIETVPSEIQNLKSLEMLNVGWNSLTCIATEIAYLPKLEQLTLQGNKNLQHVPLELQSCLNLIVLNTLDTKVPFDLRDKILEPGQAMRRHAAMTAPISEESYP